MYYMFSFGKEEMLIFKIMVVKRFTQLRRKIDEHGEIFNKEEI